MNHVVAVTACLLIALPVLAVDGAIPLWEPTVITEPGRYVLTRNITTSGNALAIESSHVVVDLNGFRIHCDDPNGNDCVVIEPGFSNITIENGIVTSSATFGRGISMYNLGSPLRRVTIRNNIITAGYEAIGGGPDLYAVVIVDNRLRSGEFNALFLNGGEGTEIRHNNMNGMFADGSGMVISDNTVSSAAGQGIAVSGHDNRVVDNTVAGAADDGIQVQGDRNHIEGNQSSGNGGYGIRMVQDDNVYRGNTARGNGGTGCTGVVSGGDFCDEGSGNTSHGDNYLPNLM